jgi:uncharacterized LabA/DUF88 family protein
MATAVFVDAGFFLKRFTTVYRGKDSADPSLVARTLHGMALDHLTHKSESQRRDLYRIFVYDCPPLAKKVERPVSKAPLDFSKTHVSLFRLRLHEELKSLRKVALRLGRLQDFGSWKLHPHALRALLRGERVFTDLSDDDFSYDVRQKGTDMKIGIDIASVSLKRQVDQIVLVSGDADFVPAAKLARREGVDFVLDPMWHPVPADLHEHIDGLRSTSPRPLVRGEAEA